MKKLFFTAIAMIAFSGVSMANTIEEKEDMLIVNVIPCSTQASLQTQSVEDRLHEGSGECFSAAQYQLIYDMFMHECQN